MAVITREFVSHEAGHTFISRLEGLPRCILALIPDAMRPHESTIDHLVAIIRSDKTGMVYVNELSMVTSMRAKGPVNKGEKITLDRILDIHSLRFDGIEFKNSDGVVIILSAGWRKGLFYDLSPLGPGGETRMFDVESALGQYYAYLLFQHMLSIQEAVWNELQRQDWFPFIHLSQELLQRMLAAAESLEPIDSFLDDIARETLNAMMTHVDAWQNHPVLDCHYIIIQKALEEYAEEDYVSSTGLLMPRIEGVMRSHHLQAPTGSKPTQGNLVAAAIDFAELPPHSNSLLLPERFRSFLTDHFFRGFDPKSPDCLSRHTVAHGVAPAELFNKKSATLGFLVLLQLTSLLPRNKNT